MPEDRGNLMERGDRCANLVARRLWLATRTGKTRGKFTQYLVLETRIESVDRCPNNLRLGMLKARSANRGHNRVVARA